ncbi:solute carrier family 66 member 3 isoform X2 [Halyomorpha halys]
MKVIISTILYFGLTISFLMQVLDPSILTLMVPFCTPVSLSSKAIQLWEILRKQNADSVSVTTWIISALTNGSRIYTILMDSKDILLLTNFTLSTVMSGSIALTAYIMQQKKKQL